MAESGSIGTLRAESATSAIEDSAAVHGQQLLRDGITVTLVVNGYGDLCQVVTQLAGELDALISSRDFPVFNRCLDDWTTALACTEAQLRAAVNEVGVNAEYVRRYLKK